MANEAVIIELLGDAGNVVRFTVANAGAIPKGTLMTHGDDRTIVISSADNQSFAGIAASEKVASDGQTTLGVYTCGIFTLVDSGADETLGNHASIAGANVISTTVAGSDDLRHTIGVVLKTLDGAGRAGPVAVGWGI